MFQRLAMAKPRLGVSRIDAVVAVNLLVLTVALLIPACERQQGYGTRTQGINNLKQIGLAFHGFADANKRLPFNGTKNAVGNDNTSGSWAFQILPFIDQTPMFNTPSKTAGIQAYICPQRGRPLVEKDLGAWTDYFINNYLNDPANATTPNNADTKQTLVGIADGTSNTIFVGQGNIATGDYSKEKGVAGSHNIYVGGGAGTMRAGGTWLKGNAPTVTIERDSSALPNLAQGAWGGPYSQGGMMCMGDATVRFFPYSMSRTTFGAFLTPTGGEKVELPD